MTAWLVIISVGAGTYALRAAMFVFVGGRRLPGWTTRPMALVAPAAIAALVAGMALTDHGHLEWPGIAQSAALATAFVAVRLRDSVVAGLLVGFPTLWLLTAVFG